MKNMTTVTPERLELVKAAFTDAADADDATRHHILQRLQQVDPVAADMLQQLLKVHDDPQDDSFLEPIMRPDTAFAEPANRIAAMPELGDRYRVIRLLGCGGVGDVYLAEEAKPVSRQVAIKVFRPHRLDGQRMRRFGIEALALGTLSHPGIAQVFGAGEGTDGRPYLAMEYVPGLPIDEACIEASLDERSILQLFIELCEAVQHAHHRGIIHRDLKPSNILAVAVKGVLKTKIIDFGVAKLADEAGAGFRSLTLHGQILGTLEYMSPEQWRGAQADTRSDVYSLAVILYRLLTKRMPFGERAVMASHGIPEDIHPEPMRELSGWLRRDIETIIGKALAHDPTKRYASPLHMAEDIGRLLRREPVLARRSTLTERTFKLLRRNPRTTVLLTLLFALIASLAAHTIISRQQLVTEVQVQRTMIIGLLDEVLDRLYVLTGTMETREAMAHSLLARTDELLRYMPNDPALREARARLLMELGNIHSQHTDREHSEHYHAEALSIFRDLTATPHADVETWRRYALALVHYSNAMWRKDNNAGRQFYEKSHDVLESLAEQYPDHPGVLDDLSWSYDRFPDYLGSSIADEHPLQRFSLRLELAQRLLSLDEDRVLSHYNLMKAHHDMAKHHLHVRETDTLVHHLREALTYGERIIAMEPARIHYRNSFAGVLLLHAQAAMLMKDYAQAETWFNRLDDDTAALYRDNPETHFVIRLRVRMQAEHAHAALTFADTETAREQYFSAKELAEQHPHIVLAEHWRLLEDVARSIAAKSINASHGRSALINP